MAKTGQDDEIKALRKKLKALRGEKPERRKKAKAEVTPAKPAKASKPVSPLAPAGFPSLPRIAGVEFAAVEAGVRLRCALLKLPYGDQGLLLQQSLYRSIGGYRPMPLMEDVDIVRRLGRRQIVMLRARAITSAARYRRDGYVMRITRNLSCLALYLMHMPVRIIVRLYG